MAQNRVDGSSQVIDVSACYYIARSEIAATIVVDAYVEVIRSHSSHIDKYANDNNHRHHKSFGAKKLL